MAVAAIAPIAPGNLQFRWPAGNVLNRGAPFSEGGDARLQRRGSRSSDGAEIPD